MKKETLIKKVIPLIVTAIMIAGVFTTVNPNDDNEIGETGSSGGAPASSGNNTINRLIEAGNYTIVEDAQGFHEIEMHLPGYWDMTSPGNPALPQTMMEILVPKDIDWSTVVLDVDIRESEVLNGSYNIAPSPPLEAEVSEIDPKLDHEIDWGYDKIILDGKNILVYEKDGNFPEESIEMIPYTQRKEGIRLKFINANYVRLMYRPFLYNPFTQVLTFIKTAYITITFDIDPFPLKALSPGPPYDYVIVTTNDIVANSDKLDNFINLKELTHDVLVVTEDDFDGLTGQAPNGRAEKIRQWLKDNYLTMGIQYVLFIGDPDPDDPLDPGDSIGDIPMKMCMPRYFSWSYRESPTDLFYADLTGNWDLDGDEFYGEDFDFVHDESPDPGNINTDYFSVRWEGSVTTDFSETYKFHTFSDGGVKLYIDGSLVIDEWDTLSEHPPSNHDGLKAMTPGNHSITLEYKEHTGDGMIQLMWKTTTSEDVKHQTIPLDHLWNETGASAGLTGRFYNNIGLTGTPDLVRPDGEQINFKWGRGDQGPGGPDTGSEVFVGRIPVYSNDYEQLDEILHKIIVYETDPGDISWRESILFPMKPMDDNTPAAHLAEGIKTDLSNPAGFTSYSIYEEDYNPPTPDLFPCNKPNVLNEWKNGYGFVAWVTHGSPTSGSSVFDSGLAPQLDNTKPAFTVQASCSTSHPERTDNLGYALLKNGAIATVGASRVSWYSGGNWTTYSPTDGTYHGLDYFYSKGVIADGLPAGAALAAQKAPIAKVGMNEMDFNLYGDPDTYLLIVIANVPPVADPDGPYTADEGSTVGFDGSGSYDPDAFPYPLEYRWDLENDGVWDTSWSPSPFVNYTWSDDYSGNVALEVRDGVLNDTEVTSITVNNLAPTITPFGPFFGDEPYLVDITTDASDPGSDDLTFEWVFDYGPTITNIFYNDGVGPDPYPSAVGGTYPFMVTDSASHEYGDNGNYSITLTVTDDDGLFSIYTTYAIVSNVAPTIERVEAYILVNFTLRAAGEKWHNVEMYIMADGTGIGFAEVIRFPGDPDDQSVTLYDVKCDVTKVIEVKIYYTPWDDPVNGQPNGATPVWVTIDFYDGNDERLHHTCNVKHPNTWEWTIGVNQYFVGHEITFESDASDPGSDDLTFTWFWDDATSDTVTTYFNDGVAADPYPSPDGIYPVLQTDIQGHVFTSNGNYNVKLTVDDDDGGNAVVVIIVILS
jgi:PKD repeat protein